MIEFVICDDNKKFLNQVCELVNKIMLKKKIEYSIRKFYDYNLEFNNYIVSNKNKKIYILDIELPSRSGIVIGKIIRKIDFKSPIIYLTGHEELGSVLLRKDLNFFAFINKFDEFEKRLKINIEKALLFMDSNEYLEISINKIYYKINLNDILYITRDTQERKIVIKTINYEYKIFMSFDEIIKKLNNNFIRTHRSCIININHVSIIDKKNKYIKFDDNSIINLISKKFKLEE